VRQHARSSGFPGTFVLTGADVINVTRPIDVEGLPTLRLVDRRAGRLWDVKALARSTSLAVFSGWGA